MAINRLGQKIGQIGSDFNRDTINAELDYVHSRINKFIERGDLFLSRKVVDNTYQMLPDDSYVGCDTSIRAFTVILPPIDQAVINKVYILKDEANNASNLNVTVTPFSTEKIDRGASKTISTNLGVLKIFSTGTEWFSL